MTVGAPGYINVQQFENPSAPGASSLVTLSYIAGVALGGDRIVIADPANGKAIYATNANLAHAHGLIGMTLGAAILDAEVTVQISGQIEEPTWAWVPGAVLYLGINGLLTAVYPVAGIFSRIVAYAETATRILLVQQPPLVLN